MILIGSKAIKHHLPNWREPLDTDFVGSYEEIEEYRKKQGKEVKAFYPMNAGKSFFMQTKNGHITEFEVSWNDSRAEKLVAFVESQPDNTYKDGYVIPSLDVLLLLKESHKYLKDSPAFLKTMRDMQALKQAGAKVRKQHEDFLKEREKLTYTYSHPKLMTSRSDFFDSEKTGVVQIYQHDSVHQAVKRLSKPAYEFFKDDVAEVYCSKELFDNCPEEVKLLSVLEESMTLAIERSLSVFPGKKTPREAVEMALMKCCTSIASGFWREYAWLNYDRVLELYEEDWYDKFLDKVEQGLVEYKEN